MCARWWLLGTLIWVCGMLAMNTVATVPWWDADPLITDLPETGLTPGQVLLLNAVGLLSACGLLLTGSRAGEIRPRHVLILLCFAIGGVAVILHGLVLTPLAADGGDDTVRGELESLVTGASWMTGLLGGFAAAALAPRDRSLRLVVGVFVIIGTLLLAKAIFERFVELPRTITFFENNTDSVLAANGIEPGSSQAAIYERRLRSQQPTTWFGLANVLASFLGAMLVLLIGSLAAAAGDVRAGRTTSGMIGLIGLLAIGNAFGLWLTGSLGAIGVTGLVLAAAVVGWKFKAIRSWIAAKPGLAVAGIGASVLAGIACRGLLLPETIERSVLFRWHYLVGTTRIFAENLILGAGPAGFQGEYTRLKPPISPENVQTPHVLVADWIGAFGLLGGLVLAGLGIWVWSARPVAGSEPHADASDQSDLKLEFFWCLGVAVAIFFAACVVQWGVLGALPDVLLVLVLGLACGAAVLWILLGVWRCHLESLRWAALAAAAVLVGHGMFDVAPARVSSSPLFWLVVGVGVGPVTSRVISSRPWHALPPLLAALPLAGVSIWVGVKLVTEVEPQLSETARSISPGHVDPGTLTRAGQALHDASIGLPAGWLSLDLMAFRIQTQAAFMQGGGKVNAEVLGAASRLTQRWPASVEAQTASATLLWGMAQGDPMDGRMREAAAIAAERASDLAPHDPIPAYRAAVFLYETGESVRAGVLARRAIRNQRIADLDLLVGLTDGQMKEMNRIIRILVPSPDESEDGA